MQPQPSSTSTASHYSLSNSVPLLQAYTVFPFSSTSQIFSEHTSSSSSSTPFPHSPILLPFSPSAVCMYVYLRLPTSIIIHLLPPLLSPTPIFHWLLSFPSHLPLYCIPSSIASRPLHIIFSILSTFSTQHTNTIYLHYLLPPDPTATLPCYQPI